MKSFYFNKTLQFEKIKSFHIFTITQQNVQDTACSRPYFDALLYDLGLHSGYTWKLLSYFSAAAAPSIIAVDCFMAGFRDKYHAKEKKKY